MSFISLQFAIFLSIFLVTYFVIPNRLKWRVLLFASLVFYAFSGLDKLAFLLGTSLVVYAASRRMDRLYRECDERQAARKNSTNGRGTILLEYRKRCRKVLLAALVVCIGILIWCKYAISAGRFLSEVSGRDLSLKVIVPLGISYYTFSSVGYLLDTYWKKTKAVDSYPRLILCMVYFPQIIQGPIPRFQRLLPQFDELTRPDYKRTCFGIQLMLWGYLKKMVIADRLVVFVNDVFGNISGNEGFTFLVALAFSVFQIYADFSGCMDIVEGISEIVGIRVDRNFDRPFFSRSVAEFWRRWHITLGTWFKDYVYMPIAISPRTIALIKKVRGRFGADAGRAVNTALPLAAVWLLTGLWHGTGWNYVVWGIYYGTIIICSNLFTRQYDAIAKRLHIDTSSRIWASFQAVRTVSLFAVGRLITVPGTLAATAEAIRQIFSSCNLWIFWDQSLYAHGLDRRNFFVAVLSILLLLYVDKMQEKGSVREWVAQRHIVLRWMIYYAGIFAVLIFGMYGPGYDPSAFVYANF